MTSAPKNIKLTYFDFNGGLGEPIRLALTIGGVEFTDERLTGEQFGPVKETFPFGQLPVLAIDGETISQSTAILRLAGKWSQLYPKDDDILAAHIDEIIDGILDVQIALYPSFREQDQEKKLAMRKVLADETLPQKIAPLERMLGSDGFAVGDKITIADIKIYVTCNTLCSDTMEGIPNDFVNAYPKLRKIMENVAMIPEVEAWNKAHQP